MELKELKDKVREFKKVHCMPLNKPKPGSKHYTEALGKMTPKEYLNHIINDIMPKHGKHEEVKMVMKEVKEVKEVKKGGNVWTNFLEAHKSEKKEGESQKDFVKRMAVVYHAEKPMKIKKEKAVKEKKEKAVKEKKEKPVKEKKEKPVKEKKEKPVKEKKEKKMSKAEKEALEISERAKQKIKERKELKKAEKKK